MRRPEMLAAAADRLIEATAAVGTPALVMDLAAADRNIERANAMSVPLRLRPHFKAHKTTELMARQVPGRKGVTCATVGEATALAAAGFDDILIANAVVNPAALVQLQGLAAKRTITVAADCLEHVRRLSTVTANGVRLSVLIEIDVGHHRCGVLPEASSLLDIAAAIEREPRLELAGIMGYEGHAALVPDDIRRAERYSEAAYGLRRARARLAGAGFECRIVSGGSTGTLGLAAADRTLTEIQAGSYVLMDVQYAALSLGFEQALFCVTTVVSTSDGRIVCDAGLKSLNGDGPLPSVVRRGLTVDRLNDEHVIIRSDEATSPKVGDRLLLIPSHVDPCVNLHDALHAVDAQSTVVTWPVDGRRRTRPALAHDSAGSRRSVVSRICGTSIEGRSGEPS